MNRQQLVTGIVGIIVGFILGFFVSQGVAPSQSGQDQSASQLPENHPGPEMVAQLQRMLDQARANPADHEVRISLGNTYYDMERYDAAIPWYEEALALKGDDVDVSTDLGTSYLATGAVEKAIGQYRKSLALEAEHPQTLQNMGFAFFSIGNYGEALNTWQRLLEAHPDYAHADGIREQMRIAQSHMETDESSQ